MAARERIIATLSDRFQPAFLDVIDESDRHRGHAGWREGGETHFRVRIATRQFAGKPRVAQHRAVMDALEGEFKGGLHALAIEVLPPDGPFELPKEIA